MILAVGAAGAAGAVPDAKLTCEQLIVEMDKVTKNITDLGGQANSARVGKVGANAGVAAADMAGARIPFAGEIVGGLFSLGQKSREKKLQEAYARQNMLNGIYLGKGCSE